MTSGDPMSIDMMPAQLADRYGGVVKLTDKGVVNTKVAGVTRLFNDDFGNS
jgi:hypothetical protein